MEAERCEEFLSWRWSRSECSEIIYIYNGEMRRF